MRILVNTGIYVKLRLKDIYVVPVTGIIGTDSTIVAYFVKYR